MICRIARAYSLDPAIVARWPLRRYSVIRNELIRSWKDERLAMKRAREKAGMTDDMTVIDMDKHRR